MIPLNIAMANQSKKLQMKQMKEKDHRVKMMSEILQGIKVFLTNRGQYHIQVKDKNHKFDET
jgi:hypothetical protein